MSEMRDRRYRSARGHYAVSGPSSAVENKRACHRPMPAKALMLDQKGGPTHGRVRAGSVAPSMFVAGLQAIEMALT